MPYGPLNSCNLIWIKLVIWGNCKFRNLRRWGMKPTKMWKSPRAGLRYFMTTSSNEKKFIPGQKVLLYNSRIHFFSRKLKSRWTGPLFVKTLFPHDVVEICDPKKDGILKVNGQRLKSFLKIELDIVPIPSWVFSTHSMSNRSLSIFFF